MAVKTDKVTGQVRENDVTDSERNRWEGKGVHILDTFGTVNMDRSISNKFSLSPSGAVNFVLSNWGDTQEATLIIIDGGTNVSFPNSWVKQGEFPVLQENGIDIFIISYYVDGADTRIFIEHTGTYEGLTGNDTDTIFLLNTSTTANNFYDEAVGVDEVADLTLLNGIVSDVSNKVFDVNTLHINSPNFSEVQYIKSDLSAIEAVSDFTVDFWLRVTKVPNAYGIIMGVGDTTNGGYGAGLIMRFNSGNSTVEFVGGAGGSGNFNMVGNSSTVQDGNFHHIAIVRESGTTKVYLDGVQSGSSFTWVNLVNIDEVYIGQAGTFVGSDWWTGNFAQFRISKTARWSTNFTPPAKPYGN